MWLLVASLLLGMHLCSGFWIPQSVRHHRRNKAVFYCLCIEKSVFCQEYQPVGFFQERGVQFAGGVGYDE